MSEYQETFWFQESNRGFKVVRNGFRLFMVPTMGYALLWPQSFLQTALRVELSACLLGAKLALPDSSIRPRDCRPQAKTPSRQTCEHSPRKRLPALLSPGRAGGELRIARQSGEEL